MVASQSFVRSWRTTRRLRAIPWRVTEPLPSGTAESTPPAPAAGAKPPRRPRYAGKNPRRFEEKYKERDPAKYAADVAKVVASGKTPAGMHRPILVPEILDVLSLKPGERAVDCTLGYGGHTRALLEQVLPGGHVLGLDVDPIELPRTLVRLREEGFEENAFTARAGNFAGLARVLAEIGWGGADAILADLGVSSMQLDDPARGFTFKVDAPLDLRLNPNRGLSAAEWLARATATRLESVFRDHSDEPHAAVLARQLVERRAAAPLVRTAQLAAVIREILSEAAGITSREMADDSVRRAFQALRIEVNDEFSALDTWLRLLPGCLKPGGRVAVLTFHSGEDRRVKQAFKEGERSGIYSAVAREVRVAGPEERRANPRSTSAKLRWAVKA